MPESDGRGIASPSFQATQIALLDADLGSERFLRQPRIGAQPPHVLPDQSPNIHGDMRRKTPLVFYTL